MVVVLCGMKKGLVIPVILLLLVLGLAFNLPFKILYSLTKSDYIADANYCETDSDCVIENSCRPSKCVNKYYGKLNPVKDACCYCDDCRLCIASCGCVNNQCKTNYQRFDYGCC